MSRAVLMGSGEVLRETSEGVSPPSIGDYVEDEDLLERVRATGRAEVRITSWQKPVTLVLGRGSRAGAEAHLEACSADGVPILRRRGGGCAVVLDPGNVIVSAVMPIRRATAIRDRFARLTEWVLRGLAEIGLTGARRQDVSDLCLGDRKIGGASLYLGGTLAYYTTTLLHSPDLGRWSRYLPHPPREPDYRRGRAHGDFVTTLAPWLGGTPSALAQRLSTALVAPPSL